MALASPACAGLLENKGRAVTLEIRWEITRVSTGDLVVLATTSWGAGEGPGEQIGLGKNFINVGVEPNESYNLTVSVWIREGNLPPRQKERSVPHQFLVPDATVEVTMTVSWEVEFP